MRLFVHKHPDPSTLAECREGADDQTPPPSFEEMSLAEMEAWKAAELAAGWKPEAASQSPEETYADHLAAGYTDSVTGIRLKATEEAQTLFAKQVTLYQVALATGAMTTATIVSVWDYTGTEHVMSTADFFSLIIRYGNYCFGLYRDYAS